MSNSQWSPPIVRPLPIILIRGFGGLDTEDERALTYQGFNKGSVYKDKRGENYIYEGMILRFIKSVWKYQDATNVVGYYPDEIQDTPGIPEELTIAPSYFSGHQIVIDPTMALRLLSYDDPCRTLWVFRYYDLQDRRFHKYGEALVRLIDCIRTLLSLKLGGKKPKVNIIAHSMGGLIVREAIQNAYAKRGEKAADEAINKIVTLGTPHKGVTLQLIRNLDWLPIEAAEELEKFNPKNQADAGEQTAAVNFHKYFPLERLLTVVGTDYRSYNKQIASLKNRAFSVKGEFGLNYNRSDGLVQQTYAQIDEAPRTFLHKPHGGFDSLPTSRESYEVATRFFFGNLRMRLRLVKANIMGGFDFIGKSEFFMGVSIKPRGVDFELFHQSKEAENCYGPFHKADLSDAPEKVTFSWADSNRLIWEGYLNSTLSSTSNNIVVRLDFYVAERDLLGIGFSDDVVFYKQYYVRLIIEPNTQIYLYTKKEFASSQEDLLKRATPMKHIDGGWEFEVKGTEFEATYRIELAMLPEEGEPQPF